MQSMHELIRQIRLASEAGLFYLALFGALALPDICGALGSDDGRATASKYKAWLRDNVPDQAGQAEKIYGLRCSLLHQGRALPHGSHWPLAFTPSTSVLQLHNVEMASEETGEEILWCSIEIFVDEVTSGAEAWLNRFGNTATVINNLERFARLRPEGLLPWLSGFPVIAWWWTRPPTCVYP